MAFTTTVGAGGTSLIGTSGVDTTTFTPSALTGKVFIGAQGDADVVNITNTSGTTATGYIAFLGGGNDISTISAALASSSVKADDGNDTLTFAGNLTSSSISGLNGQDTINLQANVTGTIVNGNSDNDTITFGGTGGAQNLSSSTVAGGQGNDTITISTTGTFAGSKINGQDGNDTITFANVANGAMTSTTIFGGQGNDTLNASGAGGAAVNLSGDDGNDTVIGSTRAADTLSGGNGADVIDGAAGAFGDTMTGGGGTDRFNASVTGNIASNNAALTNTSTFTAAASTFDIITDFTGGAGGDQLDVTTAAGLFTAGFNTATNAYNAFAAGTTYVISGSLNAAKTVFTVANSQSAGSDTLVITTGAGADFTAIVTNGFVLEGVNATQIVAANIV